MRDTPPIQPKPTVRLSARSLLSRWICVFNTLIVPVVGSSLDTRHVRAADSTATPRRPNVVFILADDLGFSDLGCYGGEIATPHLDALAAGGLRFTQFYNTARCWPSRAALMSGYYAQAIRRDALPGAGGGSKGTRPAWAPLLPQLLKPAGYRSYHSGKWHIDGPVLAAGFDHSYSLEDHDRNFAPRRHTEDDRPLPPVAADAGYFTSTAVADYAIRHLREHAQAHAGEPFFSYVCFTSPHFPLQAPADDVARYRDRYRDGWEQVRAARYARLKSLGIVAAPASDVERNIGPPYDRPADIGLLGAGEVNRPLPWSELNETQRAFQAAKMSVHAAMVDRMDREIGRIVEQLKAMNVFDDTLVLFASDNGASAEIMVRGDGHDPAAAPGSAATFLCLGPGWSSVANTPLRRHKTWVHEGGISTPLVVSWPRGIAARGALRTAPCHLVDFVPTVLELAGVRSPEDRGGEIAPKLHGRSLLPVFADAAGSDLSARPEGLWWLHEGNRAFRLGKWKLVAAKDAPWELFDLSTDRAETKNLAAETPDKVRALEAAWLARVEEFRALAGPEATDAPPAPKGKRKRPAATSPSR